MIRARAIAASLVALVACEESKPAPAPVKDAAPVARASDARAAPAPTPWWQRAVPCPDGATLTKTDEDRNIRCVSADGTNHGPQVILHANGTKHLEGRFVSGKRDGFWSQWNAKGELLGTYSMKRGTGVLRAWFDNGNTRLEETRVDGVRSGPYTEWYDNGRPSWQRAYEAGVPVGGWQQWSRTGTLLGTLSFKGGSGKFTEWNADGSVAVKGAYRRGKQDGVWSWYTVDDSGPKPVDIEFRRVFKAGKAISFTVYKDGKRQRDEEPIEPSEPPEPPEPPNVRGADSGPERQAARLPRVQLRSLRVSGGLERAAVRDALSMAPLHGCYDSALGINPSLEGDLRVAVKISESGKVSQVRVDGTDDSSFERCLVLAIDGFKFPAPSKGAADVHMTLRLAIIGGR